MRRPVLGIVVLASVWGGSYLFNEIALRELAPGVIVWSRITLGALTIWPLAVLAGATSAIRSHLTPLLFTGVVQIAIPITLITVGQQWIASSLAGVLNGSVQTIGPARTSVVAYLIPGVAVLYGATLLDEPVGGGIAIGLMLILAGSYLTARRSRIAA